MNGFYDEFTDAIIAVVEEDMKQPKHIMRADIRRLVSDMIAKHDEEVIKFTETLLDEDELYDEGYDNGYSAGWDEAKEEIVNSINEMIRKNN